MAGADDRPTSSPVQPGPRSSRALKMVTRLSGAAPRAQAPLRGLTPARGLLTISGWVTRTQQATERVSRHSHCTHCVWSNLPQGDRPLVPTRPHAGARRGRSVCARGVWPWVAVGLRGRGGGAATLSSCPKGTLFLPEGHRPPWSC